MAALQTLLCKVCGISSAHTLYVVILQGRRTEHLLCDACSSRQAKALVDSKLAAKRPAPRQHVRL
jgi:protein-arginine kinase activator protein McsA